MHHKVKKMTAVFDLTKEPSYGVLGADRLGGLRPWCSEKRWINNPLFPQCRYCTLEKFTPRVQSTPLLLPPFGYPLKGLEG